jgi:hypothetical protein
VGVKTPVFMPPMMMMGISSAQKALAVAFSRAGIGRGTPPQAGRCGAAPTSRPRSGPSPMISPGTMPETNSAEIEVLVVTP